MNFLTMLLMPSLAEEEMNYFSAMGERGKLYTGWGSYKYTNLISKIEKIKEATALVDVQCPCCDNMIEELQATQKFFNDKKEKEIDDLWESGDKQVSDAKQKAYT